MTGQTDQHVTQRPPVVVRIASPNQTEARVMIATTMEALQEANIACDVNRKNAPTLGAVSEEARRMVNDLVRIVRGKRGTKLHVHVSILWVPFVVLQTGQSGEVRVVMTVSGSARVPIEFGIMYEKVTSLPEDEVDQFLSGVSATAEEEIGRLMPPGDKERSPFALEVCEKVATALLELNEEEVGPTGGRLQ